MSPLLVTYDLRQPGRNYNDLYEAIKKLGGWWHCLESIWIIKTEKSTAQVRDYLKNYIDVNDGLIVLGLNGNWASYGISNECSNWLKDNL